MKTRNRKKSSLPEISTASLPDIVFILLFFFMTVTVLKDKKPLVEHTLPFANEINTLDQKDRIIEITIGKPVAKLTSLHGVEPKIQINDKLVEVNQLGSLLLQEQTKKPEAIRNLTTVSLKIDKDVSLGLVTDIKEELRKINLLKVAYITIEGSPLTEL